MKDFTWTALFLMTMLLTACTKNQGEANKEPSDINKTTVEEARRANKDNETVEDNDCSGFMVEAANHGKMEHELSVIASERAVTKPVKVFAQQLMGDHAKANAELTALAEKKSITLATEIKQNHSEAVEEMKSKKGESFDKAYLDLMVRYHKDAVKLFDNAAEDCDDPEIKNFSSSNLPVLKKHLEMAELMQDQIKRKSIEAYSDEPAKEGPK